MIGPGPYPETSSTVAGRKEWSTSGRPILKANRLISMEAVSGSGSELIRVWPVCGKAKEAETLLHLTSEIAVSISTAYKHAYEHRGP